MLVIGVHMCVRHFSGVCDSARGRCEGPITGHTHTHARTTRGVLEEWRAGLFGPCAPSFRCTLVECGANLRAIYALFVFFSFINSIILLSLIARLVLVYKKC